MASNWASEGYQFVSRRSKYGGMAASVSSRSALTVRPLCDADASRILASAKMASWRQYPAYSLVAAREAGARSRYLLVSEVERPVALANVRIKPIPLVPTGLAMIAQGPTMLYPRLDPGGDMRAASIEALRGYVGRHHGATLRVNPPVLPGDSAAVPAGFTTRPGTEYETFLIDLSHSLDDLHKQLNGKWRTDLRRAQKSPLRITRSTSPEDFLALQPLLEDLAKGKGFSVVQDAQFFSRVASEAGHGERFAIHLALYEGRVVGGHLGAFSGDMAVYLIGATNHEGRDLRASFLLQWAVIEYAKACGLAWYDLGGADKVTNPDVFRFKKRMGGLHYIGPPMIEAPAAWPRGQVVRLAERVYAMAKG